MPPSGHAGRWQPSRSVTGWRTGRLPDMAEERAFDSRQISPIPDGRPAGVHLSQGRRITEKYRVQLWGQLLGTAQTVSDIRIGKMLSRWPALLSVLLPNQV